MRLETILKAAKNSMIHGHHKPHCYGAFVEGKGYVNDGGSGFDRADYLRQLERDVNLEIDQMESASSYGEPGYTNPDKGILFANWNKFPPELASILEKAGYGIEWSDEWTICDCGKAVRTSPDSYGWKGYYMILNDCELFCGDCLKDDLDLYEGALLNKVRHADTLGVDWTARGFEKFNQDSYEAGFHSHQTDKPQDVVKLLPKDVDFLFSIPSVGQFDIFFDCWIRKKGINAEGELVD